MKNLMKGFPNSGNPNGAQGDPNMEEYLKDGQ